MQARDVRKVPVRGVYCPLRTRHPALGGQTGRNVRRDATADEPLTGKRDVLEQRPRENIGKLEGADSDDLLKLALDADEETYRPALVRLLGAAGFSADFARDPAEQDAARARMQAGRGRDVDLQQALTHVDLETAFARAPRLLVEGDPGSGKTTTLQHIAMSLVEAHRGDPTWAERLGFDAPYPHPVIIALREFWAWLAEQPKTRRMGDGAPLLLEFVRWKVGAPSTGEAWIDPALQSGRLCLLFDGLDEIPDDELRAKAAAAVRDVVQRYGDKCRIGITTRPAGLGAEEHNALVGRAELTPRRNRAANQRSDPRLCPSLVQGDRTEGLRAAGPAPGRCGELE